MTQIDSEKLRELIHSRSNGMDDVWDTAGVLNAITKIELESSPEVIYLCDDHGCPGCEAGTNPDHECKHTTDIAHAKNFEAMLNEETGEVVGYYEKPEHVIAQVNITDEYQDLVDEASRRLKDQIESGEIIVKNSCRPVIIHHNGRDFNGYFDSSRMLLFGSYLAAEVANDFGFTWTEVEES